MGLGFGQGGAQVFAGGSLVEVDGEAIGDACPADDVVSGLELDLGADAEGGLGEEKVRVLAVGGVSGGDEDDGRDDLAMCVDDAAG